jgi:hypothetical protein
MAGRATVPVKGSGAAPGILRVSPPCCLIITVTAILAARRRRDDVGDRVAPDTADPHVRQ